MHYPKNQYCNYSPEIQRKRINLYTTDGSLFTDTRIKSTLGNPKAVSDLFLFDNSQLLKILPHVFLQKLA